MNATVANTFRTVSIETNPAGYFVAVLYTYDERARSTTSYTLTGEFALRSTLEALLPELVLP